MAVLENLFGEFIDGALGLSAEEAVEMGADYVLVGGHTIGFWLFIGTIVIGSIVICCSKKLRSKLF